MKLPSEIVNQLEYEIQNALFQGATREIMTIETKFNIGEKVFLLFNGKIEKAKVRRISVWIERKDVEIKYRLDFPFQVLIYSDYREDRLAHSKEELIENL